MEQVEFSKWIINMRGRKTCEPNDSLVDIEVPQEISISSFEDHISVIVDNIYPNLLENYK